MIRQVILSREQDFGLIAESFARLHPTVPKWVKWNAQTNICMLIYKYTPFERLSISQCLEAETWRSITEFHIYWLLLLVTGCIILVLQNYPQKELFLSTNQMFSDRSDLVKTPLFFWPVWSRSTSHMHILKAFGWWLLLILCFRVFAKYFYFLPQLRNVL